MKLLIIAAVLMTASGTALADERDHVNASFQSHEHYAVNQPAVGSPDIDYVHLSFQENELYSKKTGSQPEIGGAEIDYLNDSFQDSY